MDRGGHHRRLLVRCGSPRGTKGVAGLASGGLIIGTLIPGIVLVLLGVVFLGQGNESAAPMTSENLLPAWASLSSLVLIVNNFLSYSGMEMNAVHVSSLKNPGKEFPKSMFLAMGLVLAIFILPAAWRSAGSCLRRAVPDRRRDAGLRRRVRELRLAVADADRRDHAGNSLARRHVDLAGRTFKGLLLISRQEGYLPPFLQRLNKNGVQQNILVVQGVDHHRDRPRVRADPERVSAYWMFSVITTQVYLIMYLLMFVAAVQLGRQHPDHARGFRAPCLSDVWRRLRRLAGHATRRVHPALAVRRH